MKWRNLALLASSFFLVNYAQYQLTPLAAEIMAVYHMDDAAFSAAFSAPMLPGIFLALTSGFISDRFGVKRVMAGGFLLAGLGMLLRALSISSGGLYWAMLLLGFGVNVLYSNYAKILSASVPPARVEATGAIVLCGSAIGMFVGTGTTAYLPSLPAVYGLAAGLTSALFLGWALLFQNLSPPLTAAKAEIPPTLRHCLGAVVKARPIWVAAICMFVHMSVPILMGTFLPLLLTQVHGLSATQAGLFASVLMVGNLAGSLLGPFYAGQSGRFRATMVFCAAVNVLGLLAGWRLPPGAPLAVAMFLLGAAQGAFFSLTVSVPAFLPHIGAAYGGTAGGIICTMQMLGAVLINTWVIVPLSGGDYTRMFVYTGLLCVSIAALCLLYPRTFKQEPDVT